MTIEETLSELIDARIAPLTDAIRALTAEVEQLRRAIPAPLVTIAEAARVLGVHPNTIYTRVKNGEIPVRRVGKAIRVDLAAITRGPSEHDVARHAARVRSHPTR